MVRFTGLHIWGPALHFHAEIRPSVSTLPTANVTGLRTKPHAKKEIDAFQQEGNAPEANQRAQAMKRLMPPWRNTSATISTPGRRSSGGTTLSRSNAFAVSIGRIALDPLPARIRLQDIELAAISQEVSKRIYNLSPVGEGGRCLKWGQTEKNCPTSSSPNRADVDQSNRNCRACGGQGCVLA